MKASNIFKELEYGVNLSFVFFLQAQGAKDGKTKQKVIISDCGEYV